MKSLIKFVLLTLLISFSQGLFAQHKISSRVIITKDNLIPSLPHSVKINGYLGGKIDQCITNRIMVQDVERLLNIFRVREKDNFGYHAEFIGKWSTAAALAYRYQPNNLLKQKMEYATNEWIKTQPQDGYITTYKKADEFISELRSRQSSKEPYSYWPEPVS